MVHAAWYSLLQLARKKHSYKDLHHCMFQESREEMTTTDGKDKEILIHLPAYDGRESYLNATDEPDRQVPRQWETIRRP